MERQLRLGKESYGVSRSGSYGGMSNAEVERVGDWTIRHMIEVLKGGE